MKAYWDFTEQERAAMSDETVRGLLKFELMDKGVVAPEAPQLLDETAPEVPTRKFYRVTHREREYGSPQAFDAVFEKAADAEAFIALQPAISQRNWQYPGEYYLKVQDLQMEVIELPCEQDHLKHRPAIAEAQKNRESNKTQREAYDKACREQDEACKGVWDDWHNQRNADRQHGRVLSTFNQYVADCDGDEEIAVRFLRKAYSDEQIERAFVWFGLASPVSFDERAEFSVISGTPAPVGTEDALGEAVLQHSM